MPIINNRTTIKPKSSDKDSFKYSILISLHNHNISNHPERISKLKPYIHPLYHQNLNKITHKYQ